MSENQYSHMTEFLMFGYFGCTSEQINSMCPCSKIRMCAERAYLDWNRTIEYEKKVSEKDKESFINNGCTILIRGISGILEHKELYDVWSETNQTVFNTLHSGICEEIENFAKDQKTKSDPNTYLLKQKGEKRFYYGQAQKWLNMTLKYMDLLDLNNVRRIRKLLHVPIDRYILRAAASPKGSRYHQENTSLNIKYAQKNCTCNESIVKLGYYSEGTSQAWSRFDKNDYTQLQIAIRKAIQEKSWTDIKCPLDWEAKAWIEQAQLERK